VVGGLLLACGNGVVVVSELWIPSGLAALLVSAVPLWMVLVDWWWGAGVRPSGRVTAGVLAGFAGVALLVGSPGAGAGGGHELLGSFMVVAAAFFWAMGSIYSRYVKSPPRPRLWVATQMLAGGALLVVVGVLTGELHRLDPAGVSLRSVLALLYLVAFGSIVAYSAYIWLLQVSVPARVSTYAYVNPVVALFLGWLLADEPLTYRSLAAAAIIIGAVVVITTERSRAPAVTARNGARSQESRG
jgi:drug/metabolite transporter (DMT)-like permease